MILSQLNGTFVAFKIHIVDKIHVIVKLIAYVTCICRQKMGDTVRYVRNRYCTGFYLSLMAWNCCECLYFCNSRKPLSVDAFI